MSEFFLLLLELLSLIDLLCAKNIMVHKDREFTECLGELVSARPGVLQVSQFLHKL